MTVAITAVGVVSAHGRGVEPLAQALRAGKTGVREATGATGQTLGDAMHRDAPTMGTAASHPAEAVAARSQLEALVRAEIAELSRLQLPSGLCSTLAAQAPVETGPDRALGLLQLAADDALRERDWAPSARRAVLLGSTKGSLEKVLSGATSDPFAHLTAWLAQRVRARGPVRAIGAACASSTAAAGAGLHLIESGRCDEVIVAGVEALHAFVYSGFHALKAMSPRPAAPFDAHRQGLSMGEGAAVIVLESEAHARASGRPILGWIDGFGAATDAHDQTAPHPQGEGLLRACKTALASAKVEATQLGRYQAHGTATVQNDAMEAAMCARLFGPRGVPLTAAKGSLGHTLGAAGLLDLLSTFAALDARELWPVTGLTELDPKLEVAAVTRVRPLDNPLALLATAGFGGINAALVLRRSER